MKNTWIIAVALLTSLVVQGQVNIGSNTPPDASAILEVTGTNGGLLLPRLTTAQRNAIANPAVGLMIYNITSKCVEVYMTSGQWRSAGCDCNALPDATFTYSPSSININSSITFNPSTTGANYQWIFGGNPSYQGGTNAQSQNPVLQWANAGTYNITLVVTDNTGCTDSSTTSVTVTSCSTGSITFNYTGSIQQWTVPAGVCSITIDAYGAQGGGNNGGLGARCMGTITNITPGQVLKVLVGQRGATGSYGSDGGGGGGGSFVTTNTNIPLVIAGGGGGTAYNGTSGNPGLTTTSGGTACTINGGSSGSGGQYFPGPGGCGDGGSGGGGLTGNGGGNGGGQAFSSGGAGGNQTNSGQCVTQNNGGFGGGGTGGNGGGGGGGYSGGAGGSNNYGGCNYTGGMGGGSINNGTNQTNTAGARAGNGTITISW